MQVIHTTYDNIYSSSKSKSRVKVLHAVRYTATLSLISPCLYLLLSPGDTHEHGYILA